MKRLLLTVAIITLSSASLKAAAYSSELQQAYNYAYTVGITTQQTIESANMNGTLIRSHMAKMMVNYAMTVLGKRPDTTIPCRFSDIDKETEDMQAYIRQSCQLGLMGINISKFNPSGIVTRAQFGTVFSRALRGDINNGGSPYYLRHLQTLKDAGIMNNISTPEASEIRGYVMLMMMRAGGAIESSIAQCNTSEIQMLCLIGSDKCPTECKYTEQTTTKSGSLRLSSTTINTDDITDDTKYLGSITFSATDAPISIYSLTFQKVGMFTRGRIEDDGVNIANIQTNSSDTSITVTFSPSITIDQ